MSKRQDRVLLMFTVTFKATVKLAPAKPMCLLLIKNLRFSNIAFELLSRLSKIVSIPVHELGTSLGKSTTGGHTPSTQRVVRQPPVDPCQKSPFCRLQSMPCFFFDPFFICLVLFGSGLCLCCLFSYFHIPHPCNISSLQGC